MNKRILPFTIAAMALTLTLASCSDNETEVATFANTYEQTLAQSDSASVQIVHSVEYYKSFEGGNALKKKINNSIVKACFGDQYDGFSVEEASDAVSDTLMANYQREAGSVYDDAVAYAKEMELDHYYDPAMTCKWYYTVQGSFAEGFMDLQTYQVYSEDYLGGAHGMHYLIPNIINLKTGEIVTENELFKPGYVAPVTELIKSKLALDRGVEDINESVMFIEGLVPNGHCGVSGAGVTWYYQPYEIASYAEGIIEVTVFWIDLKPYLNPEFVKF